MKSKHAPKGTPRRKAHSVDGTTPRDLGRPLIMCRSGNRKKRLRRRRRAFAQWLRKLLARKGPYTSNVAEVIRQQMWYRLRTGADPYTLGHATRSILQGMRPLSDLRRVSWARILAQDVWPVLRAKR